MSFRNFGIDLGAQKAVNAADGTSPTDLITKQQLDNAVAGLAWKQPVRAASTTNGTLTTAFAAAQSLDGVVLAAGDRILLKNQTAGAENGPYVVTAGTPTRASDGDTAAELNAATVYVTQGTTNADKAFTQTADNITLGTTALVWAQVGGGTNYLAGNGMSLVGSTFNVVAGAGILADGTSTRLDPAYTGLAKRNSQDLPAASAGTAVVITHSLGTLDVIWQIRRVADGVLIDFPDTARDVNSVTVTPPVAITAGQYRFSAVA